MKKILNAKHPEKTPDNVNDNLREYALYSYKTRTDVEKDSNEGESGNDLDIPGAELDDEQENIGNEDEENNYYSIGGDDHNDLDEDKDELIEGE
jgi:hypothetical protein